MTVDLRTRYLDLDLRSPLVVSANPLTREPAFVARLEAAGAGAVVMPSLFEEEIESEELELAAALDQGTEGFAEALDYFPEVTTFVGEGDRYLRSLEAIRLRASIPIIASLNASSVGGWVRYARLLAEAGADALELNLYRVSVDPERSAAEIEATDLEVVAAVRAAVALPLAVKLSPFYTAFAGFARSVVEAGANGLVLFNRFYQPDIDLDELAVVPRVSLSHRSEMRLPLRWAAILRPQLGKDVSLAVSSGVHRGEDAVKAIMVGADVAMAASAVLRDGPDVIATIEAEMRSWLEANDYASVTQLRGSASQGRVAEPAAFERAQYIRTLHSWAAPPERTPTA
jgi:dihydroorotate dehydrogenase (fumarate)